MSLLDKEYIQINQALFSLTHYYDMYRLEQEKKNPHGLSLSECGVIMVIGQLSPLNSRKLSQKMEINPGTISVYVQKLYKKGIVEKQIDESDRRNCWLSLTPEGLKIYQGIIEGTILSTKNLISTLNFDEQRKFHSLLLKVSHNLGFDWQ